MITIIEPGVYDMTAEEYHADEAVPGGSLSSSGARRLLPPGCPALYRWEQDHPQPAKRVFDFGHAAHKLVLGDGPEIDVLDFDNYQTKAAQQARDEARHMGVVPLLRHEYQQVLEMAAVIRRHPLASALLAPESGQPEISMFAQDPATGMWVRSRPDWMPHRTGSRTLIPDYKSTNDASNEAFTKSIQSFGYYQQAPWYIDIAVALDLASEDAEFLFIAQEKTPPYLVNVIGLDADWLRKGRARNRAALELYAECSQTGRWPGYGDEPNYVSQPVWADIRDTEEYL
ncbi:PD-(D/E)XK nuclease-like domain-containing protein [Streptomyces virginiae]|uniref:PD-(D/E)XK nuclease-like domain-containing protein n=1 Tax=Streptomyces virginiae TaxID=1961 RepID=UPI0036D0B50E